MRFDFIVPICNMNNDGFDQRLHNLVVIVNRIPKRDVHLILVEQTTNDENPKYLDHITFPSRLDYTKIFVKYPIFNKPWLYNIGVRNSKYEKLLLSEMDVTFNPGYFELLEKYLDENLKNPNFKWSFGWDKIIYWNHTNSEVEDERTCEKGMAEGGIVFIKKDYYWEIGGGNEFIQELGGPDNEFIRRAELWTQNYPKMKATIHHLWHPRHTLKIDNWKHSTRRERNRQIYNVVKWRPKLMMGILNEHLTLLGDEEIPLCNRISDDIIFKRKKLL